jgi:DNA polymerase-1
MNETTIRLVTSEFDWEDLAQAIADAPRIGLDVETTPVPWYTPEFRLLTVGISTEPGLAYVIPLQHPQVTREIAVARLERLQKLFRATEPNLVMQNGAFDRVALQSLGIGIPEDWFDTMVAQYLLDVEATKGLTDLAARWLGLPPWKDIDYKHPEEEDLTVLARLNGRDADITLQLYAPLAVELERSGQLHLFTELMMPVSKTLCDMELVGIPVDRERLLNLHADVEAELEDLLNDIRDVAGKPTLNPNSTKQLASLLYEDFGLPVHVWTDGGAPSTNAEALGKLNHKIIPLLQRYRELRKLLTASLTPWLEKLDHNDYLHPRYKPAFVKTGRLSSEMPNIQQVPREPRVRQVFGGVPGNQIVELDYSQLELRIVAWLAGEEEMLRAFRDGEDLHQVTADAFGVDRQTAKALNFGLLYGAGARKLKWIAAEQYGVELTELQADKLRAQWFKKYPQIKKYHESAVEEARITGGVTTALGRWRPIPDINHEDWGKKAHAERVAINTPVQSLASDLTLIKLDEIARDERFWQKGVRPVATVHDSILFMVSNLSLQHPIMLKKIMEDTSTILDKFGVDFDVPLKVDIKTGSHWSEDAS